MIVAAAVTLVVTALVGVASAKASAKTSITPPNPIADCEPYSGRPCAFPFPDNRLTVPDPTSATGLRVHLPAHALPVTRLGIHLRYGPYDHNDGFSPGSTLIVHVPGLDNPAALTQTNPAGLQNIGASTEPGQPIVVIDEQTDKPVSIWSELQPSNAPPDDTELVIHPAGSFIEGHTYVVALRALRNAAGQTLAAPPWFARLRDRRRLPASEQSAAAPYTRIFHTLASAHIARGNLYEAWEFTIGSTQSLTERLLAIRDNAFAQLGDTDLGSGIVSGHAPSFQITGTTPLALGVTAVTGTLGVPCYLKACLPNSAAGFHYNSHAPDATPTQIPGMVADPEFECIIPASASALNPARIVLYGHGFLSGAVDVTQYSQLELASSFNMVLCSTDWWGLATPDKWNDVRAMLNPNLLPAQVDRMQQGVLNMLYLGRLMDNPQGLCSSPALQSGGACSLDTSQLYYDGNSTGGIQGSITTAVSPDIRRAVFGVTGIDWANWLIPRTQGIGYFGDEMESRYLDPSAWPLVLDLMQQIWDRGDPDGYVQNLTSNQLPGTLPHQVLMQIAYGDEYVPMYAGAAEARTIGADAYQPALDGDRAPDANLFAGLPNVPTSPYVGSAIEVWDLGPGLVEPPPVLDLQPPAVLPAPYVNPHESIQYTAAAQQQISDMLAANGAFVAVCGGTPCHADGYQP